MKENETIEVVDNDVADETVESPNIIADMFSNIMGGGSINDIADIVGKFAGDSDDQKIEMISNDDFIIKDAVPVTILENSEIDENYIIYTIIWLCRSKSGKEFIILKNYAKNDCEEFMKSIPFYCHNQHITTRIIDDRMFLKLDKYLLPDVYDYNNDIYTIDCKSVESEGITVFKLFPELFASFSYIDSYMKMETINNYELSEAVISASRINGKENIDPEDYSDQPKTIIVNDIKSINNIALADKKTNNNVVIFEVEEEEKSYNILFVFGSNKKFRRSKYRGSNIKNIQDTYFNDSKNYLSLFTINCTINYDQSQYNSIIINCINNSGDKILFNFTPEAYEMLCTMITEY